MKPAIQTEEIHTINFYTTQFQIEHNLAGLNRLICFNSSREINFKVGSLHGNLIEDTLKNIMPEALDEISYKRLDEIFSNGVITLLDLRILIQWLVNKEALPSGTYKVYF